MIKETKLPRLGKPCIHHASIYMGRDENGKRVYESEDRDVLFLTAFGNFAMVRLKVRRAYTGWPYVCHVKELEGV